MERKITVIPASNKASMFSSNLRAEKRKVAAYARVSTDSDEQFTSFQAQVDYYTKYINAHEDWELAEVYSDEGISGTNTKNREGFNKMINDALERKFDLIITKSVSRFARNTVDSLTTIRKLKDKGVEVYFEKENIYTFDSTGELLITIMSSLAQEESRSISENVTWGQRNSFANGKVHLCYKNFLGYEKGEDGRPKVVDEEAKIVRLIYKLFISGYSYNQICQDLISKEIETPRHRKNWTPSTIRSILTNEKYKGDARLQKTVTISFLTHESKKNEGEAPQYYVSNSHEAIIPPAEWEFVQLEIARRDNIGHAYSCSSIFANKIICGECGGYYGAKVWHSNDPWRKEVYRCNKKFEGDKKCETPILTEQQIKDAFLRGYNELFSKRESIIEDVNLMLETLDSKNELSSTIKEIETEMEIVEGLAQKLINENASKPMSQEEYQQKYDSLKQRHVDLEQKLAKANSELERKEGQSKSIILWLENYKTQPQILTEWRTDVWTLLIENAKVYKNGTIRFRFYSGIEFEAKVN